MSEKQFNNFEEFWPHFLSSHKHPATRWAHVALVAVAARGVARSIRRGSIRPLIGSALVSSAMAVLSHKYIEGGRVEGESHPVWSARALGRLCVRTVTGAISEDLDRLPQNS